MIANAGISENWPRVEDVDLGSMEKHYAVNVIGVAGLFKVVLPLLNASPKAKFVTLGSSAGVIGEMEKRDVLHPCLHKQIPKGGMGGSMA